MLGSLTPARSSCCRCSSTRHLAFTRALYSSTLQRPSSKFKFLDKIIIAFILKISFCGGRPFGVIKLTISIGIEFCKQPFSSSAIVSILKYSLLSPLSRLNISLFILSALLFVGHKITLFFIEMSNGLISFPKISVIKSPLDTKLCGIFKRILFPSNFVKIVLLQHLQAILF